LTQNIIYDINIKALKIGGKVELNRKAVVGATIGACLVAATAALLLWRRSKVMESRAHVPIGKNRWEDLQLSWGEWPGGFTVRP
jgi:hypothetical protein